MLDPDVIIAAADHPSLDEGVADFLAGLRAEQRYFGPTGSEQPETHSPSVIDGLGQSHGLPTRGRRPRPRRRDRSGRCQAGDVLLAVQMGRRNRGIGTALLTAAIERAGAGSWSRLVIRTSHRSSAVKRAAEHVGAVAVDVGRGRVDLIVAVDKATHSPLRESGRRDVSPTSRHRVRSARADRPLDGPPRRRRPDSAARTAANEQTRDRRHRSRARPAPTHHVRKPAPNESPAPIVSTTSTGSTPTTSEPAEVNSWTESPPWVTRTAAGPKPSSSSARRVEIGSVSQVRDVFVTDLENVDMRQQPVDTSDVGVTVGHDLRSAVHVDHHETISTADDRHFDRGRHRFEYQTRGRR